MYKVVRANLNPTQFRPKYTQTQKDLNLKAPLNYIDCEK